MLSRVGPITISGRSDAKDLRDIPSADRAHRALRAYPDYRAIKLRVASRYPERARP